MLDEETGAEPRVISASIVDPYLLLLREDSSILVAQITNHNELEELDKEDETIVSTKWLSGCLYKDSRGLFAPVQTDKGTSTSESVFLFLLNAIGELHVRICVHLVARQTKLTGPGLCTAQPLKVHIRRRRAFLHPIPSFRRLHRPPRHQSRDSHRDPGC